MSNSAATVPDAQRHNARTRQILEAPIVGTLLRLAAPNVLVMMMQSSVGLIETYFIAKLGVDSLAGLSLVFPVLMLVQSTAAGALGGGVLTAVARALGRGQRAQAGELVWYALAIAVMLGISTSAVLLCVGTPLYTAMGGHGASLQAALTYSNLLFGGAMLIWVFNALAAIIRGTGDMSLPATVVCGGALILIPLSPALIFGWGPLPRLGIIGGALAVLIYYAVGSAIFALHLWSGRCAVRAPRVPGRLSWRPMLEILRVSAVSSLIAATSNITIATITGFVGVYGPQTVAGYGCGARLEYLLVPLVFGMGAPIGAMVGTCMGAGDARRALRIAWIGAALACLMTEAIGLGAASFPLLWLEQFSSDPTMLAAGTAYLRSVAPAYGFVGLGSALFFAAQGEGRLVGTLTAGVLRAVIAIGGGWLALHYTHSLHGIFIAVSAGMVAFGGINTIATLRRTRDLHRVLNV
jgi:putative MATE family efflux protein